MTLDLSSPCQLAKTQGNVFATDAILATLMCCTRSVNSWDIIVQRVGNKLFFDKRDNSDFGECPESVCTVLPPPLDGDSEQKLAGICPFGSISYIHL